ncbi:MAG: InlB B-repeat-containing protein [Collinsella sp.]
MAGVDAENKSQVWADKTTLELPEGATAADLSEALFERAGLVYDATPDTQYGWRLNSIRRPTAVCSVPSTWVTNRWAYWSLVVNGEYAQLGASSIVLKGGDDVSWVYEVPEAPAIRTVTFDAGEGSAVAAQKVEDGKAAARPEDPAREGYTFAGWYSDAGARGPTTSRRPSPATLPCTPSGPRMSPPRSRSWASKTRMPRRRCRMPGSTASP